jgi:hypothetical protein
MAENPTRARNTSDHDGRNVVLFVYAVIVSVAGFMGFLLGAIGPRDLNPVSLFFLIEIQPTALGLAVYGMVTVGVVLAVLLSLVRYASRRDEA